MSVRVQRGVQAASRQQVDVVLDADFAGPACRIGSLFHATAHGRATFSFAYDPEWLKRPDAFEIDPDLQLQAGESYPSGAAGVFRIFLDSAPDRWGRLLLDRRELLLARKDGRRPRALTEWDYLLGVHDLCRIGALRFRRDAASPFLDDDRQSAAPPLTSLRELEAASLALEAPDAAEHPQFSRWLTALLAPGSSLGGARPKANFTGSDGALWIAKFPSREDRRDIGAWEMVVHQLAEAAGVHVPEGRMLALAGRHRTFACRRFDRTATGRRRFFVSAMTLLGRIDGQGGSYLDLAEFLSTRASARHKGDDLEQLWTRVVFNILVSNTDDHLRNHGFILEADGWRLAPAYDLNANPDRPPHTLAIDATDNTPDVELALATAEYYGLESAAARRILARVRRVVASWTEKAAALRLPREETELMAQAFRAA
jgi:serine/threonine-protein kinase HipA